MGPFIMIVGILGLIGGVILLIRSFIKKSSKAKPIILTLVAFILIPVSVTLSNSNIPEYEIVERDESRDNVLSVRAVTESEEQQELKELAEHLSKEIINSDTFEGLNTYAAYIRIHSPSDDSEYGGLILDSRIAYRSEGLPITGLDETDKLYIAE
ncbi:hypothetical protein [Salinibacillus xinjiangensis]|uniref:Uncharacterized protein n=1 Tax=Salinibacillus xinjiangensis TaxID=1229268 RepID=A0A6G1X837_9BACI|nr:hypothetical protein [Salinibacillus xinjiangensis]MRG86968.1 hypothetical protein [Salinibacillus xinjiangensis]